jgi:hypothetical protein
VSDQARLFEDGGPLITWQDDNVSARTQRDREGQLRRLATMHGRHGHGAEGQTCRGCAHLIHKRTGRRGGYHDDARFLKCELYNAEGYEGTDWRAKWPACGAFMAPKGHTPATQISAPTAPSSAPGTPPSTAHGPDR